jgi:hypothetical protein
MTVAALVAAGAVLNGVAARRPPASALPPASLASEAAPVRADSSSWFCAGGSGPSDPVAQPRLLLVNAGTRPVGGSLRVTDSRGRSATAPFSVPPHGQIDETPGRLVAGAWLATRVDALGGGLSAAELVDGPDGWSVAPCASETAPTWYFASGSTAPGDSLRLFLFDPGASLAVVDLSFVTSSGVATPAPYQGLVIGPGSLETVTVGTYVQDQAAVATVVRARSGTVVATALERDGAGGLSGLALWLGAPAPSTSWAVPRAADPSGGSGALSVFNPTPAAEHVRVDVRLPSGPVSPFEEVVGPESVWTLQTSAQLRIPPGTQFAALVTTARGEGVVVSREEALTGHAPVPQWASQSPTSAPAVAARRWVVPAVGPTPGARVPVVLGVENPGRRPVRVRVLALSRKGDHRIGGLLLGGGRFASLRAGTAPLVVTSSGAVAVVGDASGGAPAGLFDVPAVPQA